SAHLPQLSDVHRRLYLVPRALQRADGRPVLHRATVLPWLRRPTGRRCGSRTPWHGSGAGALTDVIGTDVGESPAGTPMVLAEGVRKSFGRLEVLKGIDLRVGKGEVMCILGPSGSG